ncbi:MAG TPA: protein translocase subunit SecF [Bryobacteraceae bacterium]|jgi:preprotein translocase subunit SecF
MEIFKNTNFDFLGKKWPFIGLSLALTAAGLISLAVKGGPLYGIDFKGGALMHVKFTGPPPEDAIRKALSATIPGDISVQRVTTPGANEVIVSTDISTEEALNKNRQKMEEALRGAFGDKSGKEDLNNTAVDRLTGILRDGLARAGTLPDDKQLGDIVHTILDFKNGTQNGGLLKSFDQLSGLPGVTPQVLSVLKDKCYLSPFHISDTEVVGPRVGAELRTKALLATLYALGGMLIYIAFRFEWIYGVAAVIAVFHDTIITLGLFSIFNKEISLTVVAALLTLVGYSMNDTIVTFDRIRENLRIVKKAAFDDLVNLSINQTLSRTILTSGLTFLTALSLWLFGGSVLNGFAFALVVGIMVGTYSSVFVACPILIFWRDYADQRRKQASGSGGGTPAGNKPVAAGVKPVVTAGVKPAVKEVKEMPAAKAKRAR